MSRRQFGRVTIIEMISVLSTKERAMEALGISEYIRLRVPFAETLNACDDSSK